MAKPGRKNFISILIVLLIYFTLLFLFATVRILKTPLEKITEVPTIETIVSEPVVEPQIVEKEQIPFVEEPLIEIEEPLIEVEEPIVEIEESVIEIEEPIVEIEDVPFESPLFEEPEFFEVDEYDPWADFYVAGEEDYSIFSEGEYMVPLFINSEYLTDINVIFDNESVLIEVEELKDLLSSSLTETFRRELFSTDKFYFTLEDLHEFDVDAWFDYMTFELHLIFSSEMMPVRILSINRGGIARYSSYSMSGSETLKPAWFSWFTNLSAFSLIDVNAQNDWKVSTASLFTLQAKNSVSLGNVAFDFSYSVHPGRAYNENRVEPWSKDFEDYVTFQGIQGFYDITSKSLRFYFGNVNDYLGYSRESIGVALEKRYAYGNVTPKNHQFEYEVVVEEPSVVEIFVNEKSVYRRELQSGIYKLRDFIFSQGANRARVVVTPTADESRKTESIFTLGYDSRLLAKGDTLYSISLSLPQKKIENVVFRANQQIGLLDTFSGSYAVGLSTSAVNLILGSTLATTFGSFDFTFASSYSDPLKYGYLGRVNYRIGGSENSWFSSFDISVGYNSKEYETSLQSSAFTIANRFNSFDVSASVSGSITKKIRFSVNGNLNWSDFYENPMWRVTASTGLPIIPNLSLSGSLSLSSSAYDPEIQLRGQISASYSFAPSLTLSASSDLDKYHYANISWRPLRTQNNNIQVAINNIQLDDPLSKIQGSLSYSHSSRYYGLSIRQQFSDNFNRYATSISFNTSLAFANGLFGISRSISDNFFLVHPTGALKGGKIAVTRTMSSEPATLPSFLGTSTYSAISVHQQNNVVVYGVGDSLVTTLGSYIYDFTPRPRQGYAVKIRAEMSYSVVGTLLRNNQSAYSRYATDIYKVELDEDDQEVLINDESIYLFTDESGFFFISGISAGLYQFSLFLPGSDEEDPPVDVRFKVTPPQKESEPLVFILTTFNAQVINEALEQQFYDSIMGIESEITIFDDDGYYQLAVMEAMDEETFWNSYYPNRERAEASFGEFGVDSGDAFIERSLDRDNVLSKLAKEKQTLLFNLARLRYIIKPYFDATAPLDGWKPALK
jgi:outer membrane usher protein